MSRIRVMHVLRTMATGGTEGGVRKLLSGLSSETFEQIVCTLIADPMSSPPTGVRTVCLQRAADKAAFLVPQLAQVFRRERPDVVHSRNWAAIEAVPAAKLARVPLVIHSEHGRDLETMGRQPWRRRAFRRFCYNRADHVFCVSQELRDYYVRELGLRSEAVLEVVPNGVDTRLFRSDPTARTKVRDSLGVSANTLVVGAVGRLDPVKDHRTLFAAAEMALQSGVDLQLVVVGDGVCRSVLEQDLASRAALRNRCYLAGDVRNVADWLNAFDAFVLPSLSEGMSNTLLETMAVGVPPIATAVGGNTEVIEDGVSGMLVRPQTPEEICHHLQMLAASADLRAKFGRSARERVLARFSLERMLKRYEQMYCELSRPKRMAAAVVGRA